MRSTVTLAPRKAGNKGRLRKLTVVRGTQSTPPMRRRKLGYPSRCRRGRDSNAEPEDEPATEKHAPVLCRRYDRRADKDYDASYHHTDTATESLASGACEERAHAIADCIDKEH